jgi:hypothetical protein
VSATKQPGVFSLNLYGGNLQKLQVMCEFRENPVSDNHTLYNDGQICPTFNNSSPICGKFDMEDLNTIPLGSLRVSRKSVR